MALYDYRCSKCKDQIEVRHPIDELHKKEVLCSKCGSKMEVLISNKSKAVWKTDTGTS